MLGPQAEPEKRFVGRPDTAPWDHRPDLPSATTPDAYPPPTPPPPATPTGHAEVIHLPARQGHSPEPRSAIELLKSESEEPREGAEAVVRALLDVLLLCILRTWHDAQASHHSATGWAAALRAPATASALQAIHPDPSRQWTVEELAGLSESVRAAYLAANPFIAWSGGKAHFTWADFLTHVGARRKNVPSFDTFDMAGPENNLFGTGTTRARHFTLWRLRKQNGDSARLDEGGVDAEALGLRTDLEQGGPVFHPGLLRCRPPGRRQLPAEGRARPRCPAGSPGTWWSNPSRRRARPTPTPWGTRAPAGPPRGAGACG
ncbi:cupin domain-containing protein [Streptomyces sp. NPDC057474]|uniref:cupin domain-containing protein n=1 Tax=Streptomyces sp. NPDC057474 TaxID=3346144 RepID=UPI0036A27989